MSVRTKKSFLETSDITRRHLIYLDFQWVSQKLEQICMRRLSTVQVDEILFGSTENQDIFVNTTSKLRNIFIVNPCNY